VETGTAWARAYAPGGSPAIFILPAISRRHLVGISVGIGQQSMKKLLYIQMVYGSGRVSARGTKL